MNPETFRRPGGITFLRSAGRTERSEPDRSPEKAVLDSIPQEDRKNETKEQTLARVAKYLEELNLSPDILESYPFQLSGGMRQRVGIAMGMSYQPKLLLADEPTSALDVTTQAQIVRQMMELRDDYGTSIIVVTHNLGIAAYMSDYIVVNERRKMEDQGTREYILA